MKNIYLLIQHDDEGNIKYIGAYHTLEQMQQAASKQISDKYFLTFQEVQLNDNV